MIQKLYFFIIKINNFRGEVSSISAKPATLVPASMQVCVGLVRGSVAVLAEILLRSPRKLVIFIIKKYIYSIKVSKNKLIQF